MNFSMPPVVKNLLIINIIFFMAQQLLPNGEAFTNALALHYWGSDQFRIYQLITYMFLHGSLSHLFFNMFALWMFGKIVEYDLSSKRFLTFYMVCGIGAALFNMLVVEFQVMDVKGAITAFANTPTPSGLSDLAAGKMPLLKHYMIGGQDFASYVDAWQASPSSASFATGAIDLVNMAFLKQMDSITVGASGAVFGILLAFGMMHPNDRIMLLIPPIPMKAKYFVIGYGIIELFSGFIDSGGNIAHFAHVGGMLWGWLLLIYWKKKRLI